MRARNVLVTGSSRGIGFGIARAFARGGDNVAINCKSDGARLAQAVRELRAEFPVKIFGLMSDVSDPDGCERLFSRAADELGDIGVLVNCAGKEHVGLFQEMGAGDISETVAGNLISAMLMARLAVPAMLRGKRGAIVNISSIWGVSGASCEVAYSAAKAGLIGFTKALAKELGPSGIRVNAIACGAFDTRMNAGLSPQEKAALRDAIPLGRFGEPDEAGALAVFLASDAAGYLTGQALNLDGGYL